MPSASQNWTIQKLLDWSCNYFTSKGINQPKLSSEILLASVLNFSRMQLYLNFEYILTPPQLAKFKEFVLKRIKHVPVQYVLNEAHFRHLKLYVDERVLIPRPETELLIDKVLNLIHEKILSGKIAGKVSPPELTILEIGTGSGAIALSLATELEEFIKKEIIKVLNFNKENQETLKKTATGDTAKENRNSYYDELTEDIEFNIDFRIIATEKSTGSLEVALKNAESILHDSGLKYSHGMDFLNSGERGVIFLNSDIIPAEDKAFKEKFSGKVNIVVSNPPYIRQTDFLNLPEEVKNFEPSYALLAGEKGTEVYENIIERVKDFVAEGCHFIFETDPPIVSDLIKLLQGKFKIKKIQIERDYNQHQRIIYFKLP